MPFLILLLASPHPAKLKWTGAVGLALAPVPFVLLVLAWHGLVPPSFQEHHARSLLHLYAPVLPLMILGVYAPFFHGPYLWRQFRAGPVDPRRVLGPGLGFVAALATLAIFPLFPVRDHPELAAYFPADGQADWGKYFGGWIYSIADRSGPLVLIHNSFLFWLALPSGAAFAAWFLPDSWQKNDRCRQTAALFLAGVLLSSVLNVVLCQKYYDGLVLLYLIWRSPGEAAGDTTRRTLLVGLILGFFLYALVFPWVSKAEAFHYAPVPSFPPPP